MGGRESGTMSFVGDILDCYLAALKYLHYVFIAQMRSPSHISISQYRHPCKTTIMFLNSFNSTTNNVDYFTDKCNGKL